MDVVKFFGNSRSEESSTRALKKKIPVHHAKTDHFGNSRLEESSTRALENDIPVHHAETDHGAPPQYAEHAEDSVTLEGLPLKRPSDLKVIAVMGPTGSGKSTLISKLAGQNVMVGHNLSSCTQDVEEFPCKIGDKNVIMVDTPGFNDTVRSDTEILMSLVDWMKESYEEKELSGIIYLHSISDARMTRSSLQNLRMFRKLCGDDNLQNVILATTKWGITPESDALAREKELCSNNEFWGLMIKDGAMVERFDNTKDIARYLVEKIFQTGTERFTPKIQQEVVKERKKLSDTDAGAFIDEALIEQAKKHAEEVKNLREEQERARRKQDRIMQEALEKEGFRLERIIKEKEEEQRILHLDEVGTLRKRIEDLEGARLERMIKEKEEEQRILHLDEVETLRKRIEDLEGARRERIEKQKEVEQRPQSVRKISEDLQTSVTHMKNYEYINRQKFWSSSWKCLICKTKTDKQGQWTCPSCRLAQRNLE